MRIALLSFNFPQYMVRLANALADGDDTVALVMPERSIGRYAHALDDRVTLRAFEEPRLRNAPKQLRMIAQVRRAIRDFKPDVIHFQTGHLWFNLAWPLLRDIPLVTTVHDVEHHTGDRESQKTPQAIMDFGYRRADRVIVHGRRLQRQVVDRLGIPQDRIDVVPAVPDIVDPAAPAANGHRQNVLFFGRIWPYKGLDVLIRAEPHITAEVPDARIVIAGRGEELDRYEQLMSNRDSFDVHNRFIADEEVADFFGSAAVVVLPYVDGSISGVVPVACTFGKPMVVTDVGILPEMVEDGVAGVVVPPRDERALADAVIRILRDDELRRRLGAGAKERAETVFAPENVAAQSREVYERAIAQRRAA